MKELARAGHQIMAPLQRKKEAYSGLRKERLQLLEKEAEPFFEAPFGSDPFFSLIENLPSVDLFCHHAATAPITKAPSLMSSRRFKIIPKA